MTVIRPNSVSGITSITAQANEINVFRSNGLLAGLNLNGVNFNTTAGISTLAALKVTGNVDVAGVLTYQDVTNVDSLGIGTFRTGINVSGGQLDVGSNIKLGNAGVVTATSFVGSGAQLTGITQTTINSNTNNYLITGTGTANTLQGEANLTFDGTGNFVQTGSASASIMRVETTANDGDALIQADGRDSSGNLRRIMMRTDAGADQYRIISADTSYNLALCTGNAPRVLIAGNSAATSIGGSNVFNAMLTVQGDLSGAIFQLKAAENTNRLMVSGLDTSDCEVNLYDKNGGQRGILVGGETEYAIKAPNNSAPLTFYTHNGSSIGERLRITSAGRVGINETSPDNILHIKDSNPFIELEGTTNNSGDVGIFFNANGNHWQVRADNYPSQNAFSIKSGTPASSTHRFIVSDTYIDTGTQTITGGNNLALQNFRVKGVWSGSGSIGKEIELISGYDGNVKMVALGYNLTNTSAGYGGSYGGDLVFHTQPLYSSPATPIPELSLIHI